MGYVFADITLKNAFDVMTCKHGQIKESEIRQKTVKAMVDTGAGTLVINEAIMQELGLDVDGEKVVTLANKTPERCKIAEPLEVHWKNRNMTCKPWVLKEESHVLLGAIPLEDMDLIVDPARGEVVGAHGDIEVGILY